MRSEHDFDPHTDVCRACHLPRDCFAEMPQIVCSGGSSPEEPPSGQELKEERDNESSGYWLEDDE